MDRSNLNELVKFRTASEQDLISLEWNGEYIHFRRLYRQIYQNACAGKAVIWVAELLERELIGQLFIQLSSNRQELADGEKRAYIYGFRIKPEYRQLGLGSQILQAAELDLMERRYIYATLNVGRENLNALRFYERHGYHVVGTEPGRWSYIDHAGNQQEVSEPAWRMQKQLFADVNNMLD